MKISASIYSDKQRELKEVIKDLVSHEVDLLHVDCNDELSVFEDIKAIRTWTNTPIDLHIITKTPESYLPLLRETPVEYVTFQYEQLPKGFVVPSDISGKKGIAVTTPTDVNIFNEHAYCDFILIMATIPGQSGGTFDAYNFSKIRKFRKAHPDKAIHVDGGVNGEVSFILRNMGVRASVSGSYLFKAPSIGHALMDLTNRSHDSHFQVKDFMLPLNESPRVYEENLQMEPILKAIELGDLGFCLVTDKSDQLQGLISNADLRKGLLRNLNDFNKITPQNMVNKSPISLDEEMTVKEMMQKIKSLPFAMMYFPVVDKQNRAKGIVTFVNLIKGEL
jgi:ribulose-phosphate 3-epimerase